MATAQARAITGTYRRQQISLRAVTLRDLVRLWPALDWQRIDSTYPAWASAMQLLVQRDRVRASGLASAYLRAFRMAEGLPGNLAVTLAPPAPLEQVETSLRVTTVASVKAAAAAGMTESESMSNALVRVSGAVGRLVLDAGRDTVRQTLANDPRAAGWQRITSGRACSFCDMLAGRGEVYSAETADFQSHDHCSCSAEPVYR